MSKNLVIQGSEFYTKKESLKKVKVDTVNWNVYYIDDKTNEKWIEEYLYPERQAGGPPQLRLMDKFPWELTCNRCFKTP